VPLVSAACFEDALWLGAVAGTEPRAQIREEVTAQGRTEGKDFVAVA
jgi:hypothetical protein